MSGLWSFVLTDQTGLALCELSTASGRSITFKRNSYSEVTFTLSHEDDAAALFFNTIAAGQIPRLKAYRRAPGSSSSVLKFRGPLVGISEVSEETSLMTCTFRSPVSVIMGDGDQVGRYLLAATSFAATDGGAIAKALVDATNLMAPTGLGTDAALITATSNHDVSYANLAHIGQALSDLAGLQAGFDFFETFVEPGGLTPPSAPTGVTVGAGGNHWLQPTATYFWVITAVKGGVESVDSSEVSRAMTFSSGASALLSWTAVTGADWYNIYRSTTTGGETTGPAYIASTVGVSFDEQGINAHPGFWSGAPGAVHREYVEAYLNVVPAMGATQTNAVFQYGPGTLANVTHMERQTIMPQNVVITVDQAGTSVTVAPLSTGAIGIANTLQARYSVPQFNPLDIQSAASALTRLNPIKTITFVPELGMDNCPKPFDDWNLGDTVTLFASRGALSENTTMRVNGFTLPIDDNGLETVSVDDPTTPEEDAVITAQLATEIT
jgi:hypothetical protein